MGAIMKIGTALAFVALLLASRTSAANDGYKCTVIDGAQVTEDGTLEGDGWTDSYRKLEFVVGRRTGRINGSDALTNHNTSGQPKVLDPGSAEQSFKVL